MQELNSIAPNKNFDYALFFLAQNYSEEFLTEIRKKVKSEGMINYQWDGLDRYPFIYKLFPFFDRFFVFNPNDLKKENKNLYPATSFYFYYDLKPLPIEYDFYFLGGHDDSRQRPIIQFAEFAMKMKWNCHIDIISDKKPEIAYPL